jgi:hypothetical protein
MKGVKPGRKVAKKTLPDAVPARTTGGARLAAACHSRGVPPFTTLAAATVDWNHVPAVKLLGLGLGALLLVWAIRLMFGRRR